MYGMLCWVQMNLSFVDSPDRANHVEYACLDRFVRSNDYGLLDNSVQNLSIYVTADVQKIKMKILHS